MKITRQTEIDDFPVPEGLYEKGMTPGIRSNWTRPENVFIAGPSILLSQVPEEDLAILCDNFRKAVMKKAGYIEDHK